MIDVFADLIIYDSVGTPFDGNTVEKQGMGGSEFQLILLLEGLAKRNYKVICFNNINTESYVNNVLYLPLNYVNKYKFKCQNLIIHRYSNVPNILYKKVFLRVTDINAFNNLNLFKYFEQDRITLITLSDFQNNNFPKKWNKKIIHNIIPEWVYNYKSSKSKNNNQYIYSSSIGKGYYHTLDMWKYLKTEKILSEEDILNVCLPGYDNPNKNLSDEKFKIKYHGSLIFKEVVELTASCSGMFYVNIMPETFGISVVLADILNTAPNVCGLHGLGALPEFVNKKTLTTDIDEFINLFKNKSIYQPMVKDFKSATMLKEWETILFKN